MERTKNWKNKFQVRDKARTNDPYDGMVFGEAVAVDKKMMTVKWDDLDEPCVHRLDEYEEIKPN